MARWDSGFLTAAQADYVCARFPEPILVENLSWERTGTVVLHIRSAGRDLIVKAAGPTDHHITREITAHREVTHPLVTRDRAGKMLAASPRDMVLVTEYVPGELVEGRAEEIDPGIHHKAGELLARFHGKDARTDDGYEKDATEKSLAWLARRHRIDPAIANEVHHIFRRYRPLASHVVPTHGDWQPRNWLIDGDTVKVIDFGRFAYRPAATDLCRLAVQQWRAHPELEVAFLDGYGHDPRETATWRMHLLREAVGTAVWAYEVGDEAFERQGHRMLREALARF